MTIAEAIDFYENEYHKPMSGMTHEELEKYIPNVHEFEKISIRSLKAWECALEITNRKGMLMDNMNVRHFISRIEGDEQ